MENICRLCLNNTTNLINFISIENQENDKIILNKIFEITTVSIVAFDNLPSNICSECIEKINSIYEFRTNCIENQELLLLRAEQLKEQPRIIEIEKDLLGDDQDHVEEYDFVCDTNNLQNKTDRKRSKSENKRKSKTTVCERKNGKKEKIVNKENGKLKYQKLLRPCDICGKMIERSRLEAHSNRHKGVQPYVCDIENCGRSFYSSYLLTSHKTAYHVARVFKCRICEKPYNLQKSLYNHEQKHNTPKYNCQICGRQYKNSTYLKEHLRSHTGERPYSCSQCQKCFSKSSNLKTHFRTHTKEKPFCCLNCGVSYGYKSLLKSHSGKCRFKQCQTSE